MKTLTTIFLAIIFSINLFAQAKKDTVRINLGKTEILILNDEETVTIPDTSKKEISEVIDTTITKKEKRKYNGHWAGVELGINNYMTKSGSFTLAAADNFMELTAPKSLGVNINFMEFNVPIIKNNFGFTTGMGLQINNYRLNNTVVLQQDSTPLTFVNAPTDIKVKKYKLSTLYLTIPLMFEVQKRINKSDDDNDETDEDEGSMLYFAVGGFGGVRIASHTKQVYEKNGSEFVNKTHDDFNTSFLEYGLTARFGVGALKLYVNYNLSPLFADSKGPELYPISGGICFNF